jgi:hypothetical protein
VTFFRHPKLIGDIIHHALVHFATLVRVDTFEPVAIETVITVTFVRANSVVAPGVGVTLIGTLETFVNVGTVEPVSGISLFASAVVTTISVSAESVRTAVIIFSNHFVPGGDSALFLHLATLVNIRAVESVSFPAVVASAVVTAISVSAEGVVVAIVNCANQLWRRHCSHFLNLGETFVDFRTVKPVASVSEIACAVVGAESVSAGSVDVACVVLKIVILDACCHANGRIAAFVAVGTVESVAIESKVASAIVTAPCVGASSFCAAHVGVEFRILDACRHTNIFVAAFIAVRAIESVAVEANVASTVVPAKSVGTGSLFIALVC